MIKFVHYRTFNANGSPSNKGGATVAYVEPTSEQDAAKFAIAWCNPSDNFNRPLGRVKSAGKLKSPRLSEYDYVAEDGSKFIDHMDEFMAKMRGYYRRRKGMVVQSYEVTEEQMGQLIAGDRVNVNLTPSL